MNIYELIYKIYKVYVYEYIKWRLRSHFWTN